MWQIRHPLVEKDLRNLVDHVLRVTGDDFAAAGRHLEEVDSLLADVAENPLSGIRLSERLGGWLIRHGGRGSRLTIVFRPELQDDLIRIALIPFGAQNWLADGVERKS